MSPLFERRIFPTIVVAAALDYRFVFAYVGHLLNVLYELSSGPILHIVR